MEAHCQQGHDPTPGGAQHAAPLHPYNVSTCRHRPHPAVSSNPEIGPALAYTPPGAYNDAVLRTKAAAWAKHTGYELSPTTLRSRTRVWH